MLCYCHCSVSPACISPLKVSLLALIHGMMDVIWDRVTSGFWVCVFVCLLLYISALGLLSPSHCEWKSILRIASLIGRELLWTQSSPWDGRAECLIWYECFAGEAYARVCTRLRTCACIDVCDCLEWRISPVTVLWELVGADVCLSMCFEWKRDGHL